MGALSDGVRSAVRRKEVYMAGSSPFWKIEKTILANFPVESDHCFAIEINIRERYLRESRTDSLRC